MTNTGFELFKHRDIWGSILRVTGSAKAFANLSAAETGTEGIISQAMFEAQLYKLFLEIGGESLGGGLPGEEQISERGLSLLQKAINMVIGKLINYLPKVRSPVSRLSASASCTT